MDNIIYHNPNWSKSIKSVEILNSKNIKFKIVQYLKEIPTVDELILICKKLKLRPRDILRKGEKDYKENNIANILENDDKILDMMAKYPKIIERPIIIIKNKAVIGRPPENILDIL